MSKDARDPGYQEVSYWSIWPDLCKLCQSCSSSLQIWLTYWKLWAVILKPWKCKKIKNKNKIKCLAWLADFVPQLAPCFAGRFPFPRCQRASVGWSALRCAGGRVLVSIVYREHTTVTPLSQAWNLSGTFPSPSKEWGWNRGLCELVLIQSDQRVSVQHC